MARKPLTTAEIYGVRPSIEQLNAKYGASQASNQARNQAVMDALNRQYGASARSNRTASINAREGATATTNRAAAFNNQQGAFRNQDVRAPVSTPRPAAPRTQGPASPSYAGSVTASDYYTPWRNEAERIAANAAWMQQAGLPSGQQPTYTIRSGEDLDEFRKTYGMYGMDGTGGIFNPAGYSSNPYYLQTVTGITRDMTRGTALENVPDKIIGSLVKRATPWDNDSWIDPATGGTSSVQQEGFYNKGELRRALAELTNQQYQYALGIKNLAAPLASPGGLGGSDLSALQQAILDVNRQHAAAMDGGHIPAIGVHAGIWQPGPMLRNRTVQDVVSSAPAQEQPEQPAQEDIVAQILRDLEVERRKKQQNIAEGI